MTGEKKRVRKSKVQPSRTLEQVALDAFADTGEVSALGVLADWVDEFQPERSEFAAQLREVMGDTFKADTVRFFMTHAGISHGGKESAELCRFRSGWKHAEAEAYFEDHESANDSDPAPDDLRITWEQDHDYNPDDYDAPDMPPLGWVCDLEWFGEDGWEIVGSLGCVTFGGDGYPDGDPYRRIVEADLVLDMMNGN